MNLFSTSRGRLVLLVTWDFLETLVLPELWYISPFSTMRSVLFSGGVDGACGERKDGLTRCVNELTMLTEAYGQ